jgi:hypothetical protein
MLARQIGSWTRVPTSWASDRQHILSCPQVIRYYAAANIKARTELTISYGSSLWFEDNAAGAHGSPAVSSDEDDDTKMLARMQL